MTLLVPFLLLPLPNCFFRVCLPTVSAADLEIFLPLTTSASFGTASSNQSTTTRFAAGTINLHKKGIAVLPITCASARCRPIPQKNKYPRVLNQPSCEFFRLEINVGGISKNQNKTSDTKGIFLPLVSLKSM